MTNILVNGIRFENNATWPVEMIQVGLVQNADVDPASFLIEAYDPNGPNAGNNTPGVTTSTWTDTQIELDFAANIFPGYTHVAAVRVRDLLQLQDASYNVIPDAPLAPAPPVFVASYDSVLDVVTITSDVPYFNTISSVDADIDASVYALSPAPAPQGYIVDSPTQLRLVLDLLGDGNTSAYGTVLNYVTFDLSGPNEQTYTGPLNLFADLFDMVNTYSTIWNSAAVDGGWTCGNAATAVAEAGFFFYTDPGFVSVYGGNGVRIEGSYIGGGYFGNDYIYDNDPTPFKYGGTPQDGYFIISDNNLQNVSITQVTPLDNIGNPIGLTQLPPNSFAFPQGAFAAAQVSGDEETIIINMVPNGTPVTVASVGVYACAQAFSDTYYDPNGPNAGFNPVGFSYAQWDALGVEFSHPPLNGVDINRIDVNGNAPGVILGANYGNPIPPLV